MHVSRREAIAKAETEIVKRCIERYEIELRPLIYDTTNFATFIDSANERNTIAQRGHPKGGRRDLRLIGLALCVALDSNIPLCHQTYEGNRNDTTQFPEAIELIKTRLTELGLTEDELSELTLVYDKGNNSKANQPLADELDSAWSARCPPPNTLSCSTSIATSSTSSPTRPARSPTAPSKEVYGQQRTIVVSYSQSFAAQAAAQLRADAVKGPPRTRRAEGHRRARQASHGRARAHRANQEAPHAPLAQRRHHSRARPRRRRFDYRTDHDAIEHIADREWGKRIIFTGRHEWTTEEIIAAYRAQSKGENAFRQSKDREFVSYSPAFHWTDQKLNVHGFYCTLALMIVSLIERQIHHAGIEHEGLPLGAKLAMRLLNEIDEVTLIYPPAGGRQGRPRARTTLAEIDDTQRQLYDALQLQPLAPTGL